jgi:putative transposase
MPRSTLLRRSGRGKNKWLSAEALEDLTAGSSKELDLPSPVIQKVCHQYVKSCKQHKKRWLRYRGRKALGWMPCRNDQMLFDGKAFTFNGARYEPMHLREGVFYPTYGMSGSFNHDAKGHWYVNVTVEMRVANSVPHTKIGIDLGLETLAALSDGRDIEMPRFYRKSEAALATAQLAKKTPKRIRRIHAKIANRRKDFLHKESRKLADQYGLIVFGNVSPSKLAKTAMAKSVLDAGWAGLKHMSSYKALMRGGMGLEATRHGVPRPVPSGGPRGLEGLGMREWTCWECGTVHRRDTNSANNILRSGLATVRSPAVQGGEQSLTKPCKPRNAFPGGGRSQLARPLIPTSSYRDVGNDSCFCTRFPEHQRVVSFGQRQRRSSIARFRRALENQASARDVGIRHEHLALFHHHRNFSGSGLPQRLTGCRNPRHCRRVGRGRGDARRGTDFHGLGTKWRLMIRLLRQIHPVGNGSGEAGSSTAHDSTNIRRYRS